MKKIFISVILIISSFSLYADWVDIPENAGKKLFEHTSYGKESTDIRFSLNGYKIETIVENNENYKKISYWNEGEFVEIGKPDLPRFSRLIAIPNEGEVSFAINFFEDYFITDVNIYPRQSLKSESRINSREFVIDEGFYESAEIFPVEIVQIGEPAIMRDYRIVNVTINPFQYDPQNNKLRIVKNVDITVNTNGRGGENIKLNDRKKSRFFGSTYQSMILNYDSITSRNDEFQSPCYLFIYPDDAAIEATLEILANWKHQKGFEVVMASTTQTGTSLYNIKNYIQNAYDTWENPPEFICLVGDAGGSINIPTDHMGSGEGDQGYVRLEGGDILADAFIGRLSVASNTDLQKIVAKIANYERTPYMGTTDWYNRAILVGDPSASENSCIYTKQAIKEMMNASYPNINCIEIYSSPFVSQMSSNLNNGSTYFNYRGYWGMSGWSTSNISSMTNSFMLPFAVSLTCGTGDFEGTSDCISERFLKVGSATNPTGAIGAVSTATLSTHTSFNNSVDAGIYYGIFADAIYHMGGALNRGKLNLYLNFPQNPSNAVFNFSYWNNLMGDPAIELWTDVPQEMIVDYENQLSIGTNYLEVIVEDSNGYPVEGAWVTALLGNDDIFTSDFTDESGYVILDVDAQITGTADLTVTKHNFIPHLGEFDVGESDRFVNVFELQIDDDATGSSSGNGDGNINPSESIELNVSLKNFGTQAVNNVTAVVSTGNDFITITDATEDYGNIASGSSAYSSDDFDFSVDSDVLGGTEIRLDIQIEDGLSNLWTDVIYLQVEGPNLYVNDYSIVNDPNSILDQGETVELVVTIENLGSVDASNINGTLFSTNNMITIEDADGVFGNVTAGGTASNNSNKFEVTANTQIIPGTQFTLELQLYNADGYDNTVSFPINVGTVSITDPVGPDAYGYYCYDDGDTGYYNVPVYDWIEINIIGTEIPLYDNGDIGDSEDVDLPITFRFYGEEYNTITVCSNGWIAPGHSDMSSFMNWNIPGPLGPSPMIAPFWDDLKTGSGDVYYYYDSGMNYFVVEWDNLQSDYNSAQETFQVILYDSNYYPTATGDSEIKFQYKVINNCDQGNYPYEQGQYATVGIEDHTGLIGLEYTFNNSYPVAAKHLQDEMALLITGPPIAFEEPFIVLGGITIIDANANGQLDYAENADIDILLNNLGENSATGVSAVISSSDPYITITQDTSNYNNIAGGNSGTNLTDFSVTVDEDCPDGHIAAFTINVTSNENTWELYFTQELNAPVIEFSSVLINDGQNNILDPGETVDLLVSYENTGGADAYNVASEILTTDIYITINSATYDFGDFSSGLTCTAIYNVTCDASAPVGHEAEIDWTINGDYGYSASGEFVLAISQVPVLITENFNTFLPDGWSRTSTSGLMNWVQGSGNYAGGTAPEANFYWVPQTVAVQRLITMPINTMGSSSLDLEFKHSINNFGGGYEIRVETTSDGVNWNTVQIWPAANYGPATENIIITTPDVGSDTFQLAFTFDGDSWNINYWYVDDVIIEGGSPQTMGYINGEVSLVGGSGNIEDVEIIAGAFQTHPDENGDYVLPTTPGTYEVSANLEGYGTVMESDVVVVQNQIVIVDFELTFLDIPIDLTAAVVADDVTLEWNMPVLSREDIGGRTNNNSNVREKKELQVSEKIADKNEAARDERTLTGFKVYRNEVEIAEIADAATMYYEDNDLENGIYEYYITAIYEGSESLPSDVAVAEIDFSDAEEEILIPKVTSLIGNYPNPFNPTTTISFNLTTENTEKNTEIIIYNIKGQKVRMLLNERMSPGFHKVVWNGKDESGRNVSSGIYFYKFSAGNYSQTKRMLLLK